MSSFDFGDFVIKFDDEKREAFAFKRVENSWGDLIDPNLDIEQIHDYVGEEYDDDHLDWDEDDECL